MSFVQPTVLNVENLKEISELGPLSILSEVRRVSRGLHCLTQSGC